MTLWTLIRRNLRFHARAHLGVVLGAAIGSAALIGALVVGDSVRETLTNMALRRLGKIHFALSAHDRLFQTDLRPRLSAAQPPGSIRVPSAPSTYIHPFPASPESSALVLPGIVARQDGAARANRVNVLGVVVGAWPRLADWGKLSPGAWLSGPEGERLNRDGVTMMLREQGKGPLSEWKAGGTAFVNQTLARQLAAREGDEVILRVRKPSALGLDAAISPRNEDTVAIRLKIGAILPPDLLSEFSLMPQSAPPANLFLPLGFLSDKVGVHEQANLLVAGPASAPPKAGLWDGLRTQLARWLWRRAPLLPVRQTDPMCNYYHADPANLAARAARRLEPKRVQAVPDQLALPWLNTELARAWLPEDAGLSIHEVKSPSSTAGSDNIPPSVEVASARIFLEPVVAAAALTPRSVLLTNRPAYQADNSNDLAFAQLVTNGVRVLTYLANLIRAGDRATPYSMVTAADGPFVPAGMGDDEILVNQWLADDLQVKAGDSVALSYYVVDSGSRLVERTNSFRVRQVVPLKGIYADRTLMPEFPGLAKAETTRDWDAGFPLVYPIRAKDEAYWKTYRGTPKAFVTLAAGQAMWANRFGAITAIRYAVPTNTFASTCCDAVYRNLLANLRPEDVGLRFEAVREQALKAAAQGQDFGQLFLGFSLFLVMAALLLMALLFQLGLEQRTAEVGILLALGLTSKQVRRLLLAEGAALALVGGVIGALVGLGYAKAMVWALTTVWRSAIGSAELQFHATAASLFVGLCASTVVATLTIWLTLRKLAGRPARVLLGGEVQSPKSEVPSRGVWLALASGVAAVAMVCWALVSGRNADPGVFFGAGALLLVAGLAAAAAWLGQLARAADATHLTLRGLGVRGCARRPKRSLATIALLACGSFVIVAIGVFRLDASRDATRHDSGTGGFALIGESTMPIVQDLNTKAGREFYGLNAEQLAGVNVVPLRVREGDVASCLNLNRAQRPRLLGVKPELLAGRFTFASAAKGLDRRQGWELLLPRSDRRQPAATEIEQVPAIGDANSIQWALGKKLGDTIDYTDEQGRPFKLRLVGAVANSVLQGSLLMDEAAFTRRFPGESGYRMFLMDAPSNAVPQVSATLSRALQDVGLELKPAAQRLNEFNAVQNTYLGTFQVLGGLGLLLGSAGLGVVALRNVLERRGELGLLVAMGFRRRLLQRLVLSEHAALLGFGLSLGIAAAAVAVLPAILSPGAQLPYWSLAMTLVAVLLNGLLWTWLATAYALRLNLLASLRNE
ncbi:MAG TPA: ABC transporter permease [Candidatus Paceibacterota bacterium]|nr:ABC transporter permease [Verrucomicrobiota bacterium]HSA09676.1 ABC transporter permease [Candidatus Paceibacterota bacterium]